MATRDKSIWILIVFILAGLVIGGLIGELASGVSYSRALRKSRLECCAINIWIDF